MEITRARWIGGLAVTLIAVGVYFARPGERSPQNPHGWTEKTLREEHRRQAYDEARRYAELLRVLSLRDSARQPSKAGRRDSFDVRVDATLPAPLRAAISARIQSTRKRLGIQPLYPISVVVVRDTVSMMRGLQMSRYGILRSSSMPESGSQPCLALIQLRESNYELARRIQQWSRSGYEQPLSFGICGFVGRFGAPGAGMSKWISARWHNQVNPDLGAFDRRFKRYFRAEPAWTTYATWSNSYWWIRLNYSGLACGAGNLDVCKRIALTDTSEWGLIREREHIAGAIGFSYWDEDDQLHTLGGDENMYLGDLARSLGPERFAKLWRSNDDISTAFVAATGKDIGTWTHDWIVDTYGPQSSGAPVAPLSLMSALILIGGSIAAAMFLAERRRFV